MVMKIWESRRMEAAQIVSSNAWFRDLNNRLFQCDKHKICIQKYDTNLQIRISKAYLPIQKSANIQKIAKRASFFKKVYLRWDKEPSTTHSRTLLVLTSYISASYSSQWKVKTLQRNIFKRIPTLYLIVQSLSSLALIIHWIQMQGKTRVAQLR